MRFPGSHAHHIVASGSKFAEPARAALQRFGIGIDDAANGVFLPAEIHNKIHTGAYYDMVNSALSQVTSREQALGVLSMLRKQIGK